MKSISTLQQAQVAINEIFNRLDTLSVKNWDRKQTRIVNAHPSVDDYDYVTRCELLRLKEIIQTQQQVVGRAYDYDIAVFGIAIGIPIVVMDDVCPHHIVAATSGIIEKVFAKAKYASVGGDIRLQVLKNKGLGSEQILFYITLPASSTAVVTLTTFDEKILNEGDFLSINVLQIGSTYPGSTIIVKIRYKWQ